MSLKTKVLDRVPTFPGRVKLVPVPGAENTYDMERADQPTVAGTPLNAFLFNKKADTLTENVTVYVSKSGNDSTADGTSAKPYRTIQAAIDSIPKNLGGFLAYIHVGAGTYTENVTVEYFADGRVIFTGAVNAAVKIQGMLTARRTVLSIENIALTIENSYVYVTENSLLNLDATASLTCTGSTHGLYVRFGSDACLLGVLNVRNTTSSAVRAGENSTVYIYSITGSGNNVGLYAYGGFIWFREQSTGSATEFSTAHGGRILNGAQTLVPKY